MEPHCFGHIKSPHFIECIFLPYHMKSFSAIAQPIFISPLPPSYALHTLEEGGLFRKYVKETHSSKSSIVSRSFFIIVKSNRSRNEHCKTKQGTAQEKSHSLFALLFFKRFIASNCVNRPNDTLDVLTLRFKKWR
jgi:hypothetical protein